MHVSGRGFFALSPPMGYKNLMCEAQRPRRRWFSYHPPCPTDLPTGGPATSNEGMGGRKARRRREKGTEVPNAAHARPSTHRQCPPTRETFRYRDARTVTRCHRTLVPVHGWPGTPEISKANDEDAPRAARARPPRTRPACVLSSVVARARDVYMSIEGGVDTDSHLLSPLPATASPTERHLV